MISVNPECRAEKHRNCSGVAWDEELDEPTACDCPCHHGGDQ